MMRERMIWWLINQIICWELLYFKLSSLQKASYEAAYNVLTVWTQTTLQSVEL